MFEYQKNDTILDFVCSEINMLCFILYNIIVNSN